MEAYFHTFCMRRRNLHKSSHKIRQRNCLLLPLNGSKGDGKKKNEQVGDGVTTPQFLNRNRPKAATNFYEIAVCSNFDLLLKILLQ